MTTNESEKNEVMTWFRVIDNTGNKNKPVEVRAKSEAEAALMAARQWFGQLPGCMMDCVLPKVKAIAYTADGRITKIEGIEGLPARCCLPPSQ